MLAKLGKADVADFIFAERKFAFAIDILDGVHLDAGALERVIFDLAAGGSKNAQGNLGARFAPQPFDGVLEGKFLRAFAVDLDDAIARHDAGAETRCVFHRRDYGQILVLVELHHDADAAELAFGVLLQLVKFARIHEFAVRIERAQHSLQRAMDELGVSEFAAIDVFLFHLFENVGEEFVVIVRIFFAGLGRVKINSGTDKKVERKGKTKESVKETSILHNC